MTNNCPNNSTHVSNNSDYCSICGAKIAGDPEFSPLLHRDASAFNSMNEMRSNNDQFCPDCGGELRNGVKFCEACRYDFEARAPGESVPPTPTPSVLFPVEPILASVPTVLEPTSMPVVAESSPIQPEAARSKWEAIIVSDPSLYTDLEPGVVCPPNEPELVFPLGSADNLIGRRSDKRDLHPEIPLSDPGVSHRHAKLLRQPDLSFSLLDVGSTNGTHVNGKEARAGIKVALKDGDSITLGLWTRITIKKVG